MPDRKKNCKGDSPGNFNCPDPMPAKKTGQARFKFYEKDGVKK